MKVAIIQLEIIWKDKTKNLARAKDFIKKASSQKCDLIIFPEMFNTGFSMDANEIAEKIDGETLFNLKAYALEYKINIIAGMAISEKPLNRNTAIYINKSGEISAQYTKNYPFSFMKEDKSYQSSNDQALFKIEDISASFFICYDLRFPELFRKIAKNVDIVFVIANWPETRQMHWHSLLKARAIENQCFIVGVNRIGRDANGLSYAGGSSIISPWGEEIIRGKASEEYLTSEINTSETQAIRSKFPFLNDIKF